MPKKVLSSACRAITTDIKNNYEPGDRYLTIKEIAEKFGISIQTAQKAVTNLAIDGVITPRPKVGIIVNIQPEHREDLSDKKIIVISNKQDGHFYSSVYEGVKYNVEKYGVKTEFLLNTYEDTSSLGFGEFLVSLDTDGIIALSFFNSALPFYHCMREGRDIISDTILDNLPTLPCVQTANYQHSYEAGLKFAARECRHIFVLGNYQKDNPRFRGISDALGKRGTDISYLCLSYPSTIGLLADTIHGDTSQFGFFITDFAAEYMFASICITEGCFPENVLAYDAEDELFRFKGLRKPIETVAPSFKQLGIALSDTLIMKWRTGSFPQPLQKKI